MADRLRALREKKGVTQAQVALSMGVHLMTVSRLENNDRNINAVELWSFLRALGEPSPPWVSKLFADFDAMEDLPPHPPRPSSGRARRRSR